MVGGGPSAIHSCPHFWQRSLTTITPGRSHVPAENGQPVVSWHWGQESGYEGFFAAVALIINFLRNDDEVSAIRRDLKSGVRSGAVARPRSSTDFLEQIGRDRIAARGGEVIQCKFHQLARRP